MHVCKNGKASKTECIWFPAPGELDEKSIAAENAPPQLENTPPATTTPGTEPTSSELKESIPKSKKRRRKKILYRQTPEDVRKDFVYDQHSNTQRIDFEGCYVEFTKHFPYLGSFISYNLKDDFDISKRITKAFQIWEC